jgi:hypothetical protein
MRELTDDLFRRIADLLPIPYDAMDRDSCPLDDSVSPTDAFFSGDVGMLDLLCRKSHGDSSFLYWEWKTSEV